MQKEEFTRQQFQEVTAEVTKNMLAYLPEMILEKSEYAVTPFKLNEMPKINEISHFAHIDYQAFAINDCAACF